MSIKTKMRLYLSSYRLGHHSKQLLQLLGSGQNVGIIPNAVDHIPAPDRASYKKNSYDPHEVFARLGLNSVEIDLRNYFGQPDQLEAVLRRQDLIWVLGGNCFLLRRAMRQSGFDQLLSPLLQEDAFVYGGFSAGVCVLAPSLKGIELCDQPEEVPEGYDPEIIWDGLGIVDFSCAPHYRSDHPEAEMIEDVVAYFEDNNIPFKAMRDGDVWIQNHNEGQLFPLEAGQPNPLDQNKAVRK